MPISVRCRNVYWQEVELKELEDEQARTREDVCHLSAYNMTMHLEGCVETTYFLKGVELLSQFRC